MSYNDFDIRMKEYEKVYQNMLIPHVPIIVRIDGKAFHSYTKNCVIPFDAGLSYAFQEATLELYKEIGTFKLAYGQSDEVSILIYNPDTNSQEYFGGKLFKLISILSSIFTFHFNNKSYVNKPAFFDCRVFQLPVSEVVNYFIWRQKDATRNSVQMLAQANFSHKELHRKSISNMQDMLIDKGINWNDLPTVNKRGWCVEKTNIGQIVDSNFGEYKPRTGTVLDEEIPIFTQHRDYVEKHLVEEHDEKRTQGN